MKFIKSADGERISAVNDLGLVVAYIEKNRFGTHGHWRGWMHYKYCYYLNRCVRCDVWHKMVYPSWDSGYGYFGSWTDDQNYFGNIQEFKDYYKEVV